MARLSLGTISLGLFLTLALSANATNTSFPDDGTYKEVTVRSFEACRVLCESDSQCRGAMAEQPDTLYEIMHCRLNNGFGANPAFPSIPPRRPLIKTSRWPTSMPTAFAMASTLLF